MKSSPPLNGLAITPPTPLAVPFKNPFHPPYLAPLTGLVTTPIRPDAIPVTVLSAPYAIPVIKLDGLYKAFLSL